MSRGLQPCADPNVHIHVTSSALYKRLWPSALQFDVNRKAEDKHALGATGICRVAAIYLCLELQQIEPQGEDAFSCLHFIVLMRPCIAARWHACIC